MNMNKETQEKIQELQIFEQNIQSLVIQKQAFQMELSETENAISEVGKSKDEVYKITGSIMLKTDRSEVEKELKEKKDILSLRLKSIEKQELSIREKLDKLREEVVKGMKQQ